MPLVETKKTNTKINKNGCNMFSLMLKKKNRQNTKMVEYFMYIFTADNP